MAIETFEGLPIVDIGGRSLISALDAKKISFPNDGADFGNSGDQLRSLGDGGVEWAAPGMPTYEQTEQAISDWLDAHPEATTTVADGAITDAKLNDALKRGIVYGFETVADMKVADTLKVGMICHTNGFHTSGDGGAAWYEISATGPANEMDVIACGELFANLVIVGNSVTPEMFGAYGNLVNDDSSVFNRIFTVASEGIEINLSAGKQYLFNTALTCRLNQIIFHCAEKTEYLPIIKCNYAENSPLITFITQGSTIENIVFDGNNTSNGIELKSTDNPSDTSEYYSNLDCIVNNCTFINCIDCSISTGRNVEYLNCLFSNSRRGIKFNAFAPNGTVVGVVRGWVVYKCRFHSMGNGFYSDNDTIRASEYPATIDEMQDWCIRTSELASVVYNICIKNNTVDGLTYIPFYRGYNDNLKMTDNVLAYDAACSLFAYLIPSTIAGYFTFRNNEVNALNGKNNLMNKNFIVVKAASYYSEITDNVFRGCYDSPIVLSGSQSWSIRNNTFNQTNKDGQTYLIDNTSANNATFISNNVLRQVAAASIPVFRTALANANVIGNFISNYSL